MSARDLHRAATHMRADAMDCADHGFLVAVAEWLEVAAAEVGRDEFTEGCSCASCGPIAPAFKVARTYLGGKS